MTTTRKRLLASSLLCGAAIFGALPAAAQSTEPTTGNVKATTTESQGQESPTTRLQPNAGGFNAPDAGQPVAPAAPGAAPSDTAGEVVVTGSRIARRDYVADSPIVSVGPKAVENAGSVTLDKLLNQVPQFVPSFGSTNNNPSNGGQVNIALRGLGPTRTLVLMDGRRITPSNVDGVVDINTIPAALIENIEVVTGGQSTSYGSDAVAGVVNFKLKHNFQGVVVDALYGQSEQGDGQEQSVNVTAGSNFDNGRGNAVISLGYANRDAIFYGQRANVTRDDYATISGANTDPRILAVSGLSGTKPQGSANFFATNRPTQTAVNALYAGYGYTGTAPLNSYAEAFNNDGTLFNAAANYRGPTSIDFSTIPQTGPLSNGGYYNTGALNYIQLPQTRYNAFSELEYAITPHIKAYGQFMFTNYTSTTLLAPSPGANNPSANGTGFLVPANNPFIPADLATLLASRPTPDAPFILNKRFSFAGGRNDTEEFTNYQALVGLKGDVPGYDLTYDIFASYGHLNDTGTQTGNISHANFAAVLADPANNGSGVCSGYNPFGLGVPNAACTSYLSPTTKNQVTYTQRIVEGDFQGKVFDTPTIDVLGGHLGGQVRFAAGLDYRSDQAQFSPDSLLSSQDTSSPLDTADGLFDLTNNTVGVVGFDGGQPVQGRIDVYETYGELLIPIAKDIPLVKSLNLDIGGRYSDYSTIGSAYTYKGDLEWQVTNWFLLRGGYSRAIRAPNVSELFSPATNGFPSIGAPSATSLNTGDPCDIAGAARKGVGGVSAAGVRALCLAQGVPASIIDQFQADNTQVQTMVGGNPNLRQERVNTYTGGFVISPKFDNPFIRHISASVDYYNIEVNGVVGTVSTPLQLQKCFNEDGSNPTYSESNQFCQFFQRDPATGQIANGESTLQNLGVVRTSGIDVQVDWNFALSTVPFAHLSDRFGSLAFNLTASWLNDYDFIALAGGPTVNYRDSIGLNPISGSTVGADFPVWKGFLNADYQVGPVEVGVQEQYIGSARDSSCVGTTQVCTARGVDPTFYTNFNARYKINDMIELRGTVSNAFNQDPRFFTSASASEGQTDASTYDLIGRAFTLALKARF